MDEDGPIAVFSRVVKRDGAWWFEAKFEDGTPIGEPYRCDSEQKALAIQRKFMAGGMDIMLGGDA